jgi:hypothetical protein
MPSLLDALNYLVAKQEDIDNKESHKSDVFSRHAEDVRHPLVL